MCNMSTTVLMTFTHYKLRKSWTQPQQRGTCNRSPRWNPHAPSRENIAPKPLPLITRSTIASHFSFHTTVLIFCSTPEHQLWYHQPTPTQPAHRASSWHAHMNVTDNTWHITVSVLLQWDTHVNILFWSYFILFYFILLYFTLSFVCMRI